MQARSSSKKYKQQKLTKDSNQSSSSKNINDIMKKIIDVHNETDKKLAEMANFCFDKNCKVK